MEPTAPRPWCSRGRSGPRSRPWSRGTGGPAGARERSADRVRQIWRSRIESECGARIDYAEVADAATLQPMGRLEAGRRAVALLAARVGPARLIDNALLPEVSDAD